MSKKKKEYIDISIAYLIRQISKKEIVLPSLQRKYVWSHQQICQLFDSIMQDYPIGTFMFWKIGNRSTNDTERGGSGLCFQDFDDAATDDDSSLRDEEVKVGKIKI